MTTPKTPSKSPGTLFILSGPSGVGKTTLRKRLQGALPELKFSVSWTTRNRRPDEQEGRDYFFVSREQFEKGIKEEAFLEWARVHQDWYGTPKAPIQEWLRQGWDVLLDIDVQGARQVKERMPQAVTIFLLPPSIEELRRRLLARQTESSKQVDLRLKTAEEELKAKSRFDYAIINLRLDTSLETLLSIITAQRRRGNPSPL